jgi:MFS family permease
MVAADAVMLVALVSTVLSLDTDAARTRVLLYQVTTLVPFTLLAPLIGPLIDRMVGGRRLVIRITAGGRLIVSLLLASALDSLFLYPLALVALILKQSYGVSKSALVPSVATTDADLVEANSKLGVIAGLAATVAVVPAGLLQLISPKATLVFSAAGFGVALMAATRLPREVVAAKPAGHLEIVELHSPPVILGASAVAMMRAAVGFLQFLLFFWLRSEDAEAWFGAAIAAGALATMLGNLVGPALRRLLREETMLSVSLVFIALSALACAFTGGLATAMAMMITTSLGVTIGKLAFDSIVQRDAPAANQGRAFARFESRFQLAWVVAAIPPVIWTPPGPVGYVVVALIAGSAAVTYIISMRAVRQGRPVPVSISRRATRSLKRKIDERRTPAGGSPRPFPPPRVTPRPDLPPRD